MTTMASQITSLTVVYSTVYSDANQRKHQSSAPLAIVWGIHRGPVNSPHKGPVTRKMFPFDDVIMNTSSATHCCVQRPNNSAMTTRQKRTGTSWTASYSEHNNGSILNRNDSSLDCSHLAQAYRYYFVWRRHENTSPCTVSRVNSKYERIASRVEAQLRTPASEYQRHHPPPTTVSSVLTTRPWPTHNENLCTYVNIWKTNKKTQLIFMYNWHNDIANA